MRGPLALKVFAAIFGTAALLVAATTLASVWRVDRSFARYVQQVEMGRLQSLAEALQLEHERRGGWAGVPAEPEAFPRWFNRLLGGPGEPGPPPRLGPDGPPPFAGPDGPPPRREGGPPGERRPPPDRLSLLRRVTLFAPDGERLAGAPTARAALPAAAVLPLIVQGRRVGELGLLPLAEPVSAIEQAFLREQWRDALAVGGAALLLSIGAALAFARHLRRPVRELVDGTQALAAGRLGTRLAADRSDEFGLIAGHFNQMAARLEQQERERREWLASTSHELRTPLTVLRALIEALQEGIRQGDAATLQRLHDQVMSLSRLVDDLYQLARHDAGNAALERRPLAPAALVEEVLDAQRPRLAQAGLAVALHDAAPEARLLGDRQRLAQLVHNLLENSLRYTDAPGRLEIRLGWADAARTQWQLRFDDSPPGVPAAALPRLFERFYRGEASRSRATGGSGLGLSICRAIAEAHGGRIEAGPAALGGLSIVLTLPAGAAAA